MNDQKNEIILGSEAPLPVPQTEREALMDLISRVATDPNADVEKFERVLAVYERIKSKDSEQGYNDAMTAAQAEMRPIAADANNKQTSSRYATFAALDRALRPIYTKHGFSLSYTTADGAPEGYVRVVCKVSHRAGHSERPYLDMPSDGKGAKGGDVMTKTHATGAAITYGQRYLLKMIFNIAVGDDNDGNAPTSVKNMSDAARDAIADINACDGAVELGLWKKNKAEAVRKAVSPAELREIIALFNRRVEAVKPTLDEEPVV